MSLQNSSVLDTQTVTQLSLPGGTRTLGASALNVTDPAVAVGSVVLTQYITSEVCVATGFPLAVYNVTLGQFTVTGFTGSAFAYRVFAP